MLSLVLQRSKSHIFYTLLLSFLPLAYTVEVSCAYAEVITEWVQVGDPGNLEDATMKKDGTRGYGSVDYAFLLGKYEVTNSEYVEFLNAVASTDTFSLFDTRMESNAFYGGISRIDSNGSYSYSTKANMNNKPVNYVSFFSTARFTNWLHNGQPAGLQDVTTTEDGAYTFSGLETVGFRNPNAQFYIPNEHEWQKAAFYEPGAVTANGDEYWSFPTQSDAQPLFAIADSVGNISNPGPNVANYFKNANWNGSSNGNLTTVGSAGNVSYYGAADMGGNVFEWVEADPSKPDPFEAGLYVVRGSGFASGWTHLHSTERNNTGNGNHTHNEPYLQIGFRIAAPALPISADFDDEGDVDGDDFLTWQRGFGFESTFAQGDANYSGMIDEDDLTVWSEQFGQAPPGIVSVPEPSSITNLLVIGLLFFQLRRG